MGLQQLTRFVCVVLSINITEIGVWIIKGLINPDAEFVVIASEADALRGEVVVVLLRLLLAEVDFEVGVEGEEYVVLGATGLAGIEPAVVADGAEDAGLGDDGLVVEAGVDLVVLDEEEGGQLGGGEEGPERGEASRVDEVGVEQVELVAAQQPRARRCQEQLEGPVLV